jgi:hypothetical protein
VRKSALVMSMTQLIIGSALGFILAQGGVYSIRHASSWLERYEVHKRIRALVPAPRPNVTGGLIKYAAPLGASAALITLGVWAIGDYFTAEPRRNAAKTNAFDPSTALPLSDSNSSADEIAALATVPRVEPPATAVPADNVDPYSDPDFKVQPRSHRAGTSSSLTETLVRREEAKARVELLREAQQHLHRSQYDCEAANRADKYLKAGLDVWGFAAWQLKYFPMDSYKGATLPQCKDIKNVLDPSQSDLRSTLAQENHP